LLAVAIVPAFYMACAGALLRRLVRSVPLRLALPAAWVSLETLRAWIEPPLGFGWMRLGHSFSHVPWIAGSARVWGVMGLSLAAAGCAGLLAELARTRFPMTDASGPATAGGQAARSWF